MERGMLEIGRGKKSGREVARDEVMHQRGDAR